MHEQHWEQLAQLDRRETAKRAKCRYLAECDSFAIFLLNREYLIDPARRTIRLAGEALDARPPGYLEQVSLLAYLISARNLPLAGRLVSVEKLDPGGFFFRGSHRLPAEKLANAFGSDPPLLHRAGHTLGTVPQTFGDASVELLVLPRIPLTFIIWGANEEFPARASILLDHSATAQLSLDVLFAVTTLAINAVVSIAAATL